MSGRPPPPIIVKQKEADGAVDEEVNTIMTSLWLLYIMYSLDKLSRGNIMDQ